MKLNSTRHPSLTALTPAGEKLCTMTLADRSVTIGRDAANIIALAPDAEKFVSREHCVIEPSGRHWFVRDLGSRNHVYVERRGHLARVERAELLHDDQVCLRAGARTDDLPRHWRIVFDDPGQTLALDQSRWLQYYPESETVWMLGGLELPRQLDLKPRSRQMLLFMLRRYVALSEPAAGVVASLDELKAALWSRDERPLHHYDSEVQTIAWELRRALGELEENSTFLRTLRGAGYRLVVRLPAPGD